MLVDVITPSMTGSIDPRHHTRAEGCWVLHSQDKRAFIVTFLFFSSWKYIPRRFHCSDFLISRLRYEQVPEV